MTKEQITAEIKYQASIAPFRLMLKNGQISTEDYRVIDTILFAISVSLSQRFRCSVKNLGNSSVASHGVCAR